jgi:S1-C subfamily serine protease
LPIVHIYKEKIVLRYIYKLLMVGVLLVPVSVFPAEQAQHVSVTYAIPQLSGEPEEGGGTGFLLSRSERIVVTGYHVIPESYPALKSGGLKVNGVVATLLCSWKEADIAFLKLQGDLVDVPELPLDPKPKVGMQYESGMTSDYLMTIRLSHDSQNSLVSLGGSLRSRGSVVAISEAMLRLSDGGKRPTGAWYLITDTASKEGFSGGPAVSNGKVIGIQQGVSRVGSYGALSSSVNIEKMRNRPDCK